MFQRLHIARTRQLVLPAAFGLVSTMLAAFGSWIPSLWGDEAASLMSAERPLGSLLTMLQHVDAVHGTYYLGLHAWIALAGTSPFALRFPSAIAAGLCTAGVVVLTRRLSTAQTAIVAGVVCAVLPRITYAGSEARSYAFSAAIAIWLTVIFVELVLREQHRLWLFLAYAALLALGCYVFLYVVLMVVAHAAVLVLTRQGRRFVLHWLIAVTAGLTVAVPIFTLAYLERSQVAYLARKTEVSAQSIFVSLWFTTTTFAVLAWALMLGAALLAIAFRMRRRARSNGSTSHPRVTRRAPHAPSLELVALCTLIVPAGLLIGTSPLVSMFTARYLTFVSPVVAILIACAITRISRSARGPARLGTLVLLTAVVVGTAVPAYVQQRGPFSENNSDWAQISAVLKSHASAGDAVAFDESTRPSRQPNLALHTYPAGFAGLKDVTLRTPFTRSPNWRDVPYPISQAIALGRFSGVHRVWLVEYASSSHVDSYGISQLKAVGYHVTARYRDYRSEVVELTAAS